MNNNYPIPLNGLRHFVSAAKLGSFKLAANELHVSEAAVSQQIRNLENLIGVKLFSRGHQKVVLTNKGKQLLPFIQTGFSNLEEGLNLITKDPDPNQLTVSTVPSLAINWLVGRLGSFRQLHPEIAIRLDTSVETHNFDKGGIDLAIRYGEGIYGDLKSELLLNDPSVLVCHPSLLNEKIITREDILRLPLIIGITEGVQRAMQEFLDFYKISNEQQNKSLLLNDGSFGVEAVRSAQGISLQRLSLVADLIKSNELVYAKEYSFKKFSFYAVAPEMNFTKPKVKKFFNWLKKEMEITKQQITPFINSIEN